jgi:hypothetical protein
MALSFPLDPEIGQEYIGDNGVTYVWDGVKWAGQFTQGGGTAVGGVANIEIQDQGSTATTSTTVINFTGLGVVTTATGTIVTVTISAEPVDVASTTTTGTVKIGAGITVALDGTISVKEGLEYWTESITVIDTGTSIVSLIAVSTETNIDAVISPLGFGSIGNDAAGDKRGSYAVDWQRVRGSDNQVASGNYAVISGGSFNSAQGLHSVIIVGNNISNDSDYSVILGGVNGNTRGIDGAVIIPGYATGGGTNNSGIIQTGIYLLSGYSDSDTPVSLTTDGSGNVAASNQLSLPNDSAYYFKGTVIGKEINVGNPEIAVWEVSGVIAKGDSNTSTSYISTPDVALVESTTATEWIVSLGINNALGSLSIEIQASESQQIRWAAKIETIEITDVGM